MHAMGAVGSGLALWFALFLPGTPDGATRKLLDDLRAPPAAHSNLEQREHEYQSRLHRFSLAHVALVYAPAFRKNVQIYYAAFTPEGGPAGKDLGFGLHVIRKLALGNRTIEVNEQWAENPKTGGLFAPDALRFKVTFDEHSDPYFDMVRVAWSAKGMPSFWRASRFRSEAGTNRRAKMQVAVSAPLSCVGCHHARNPFAAEFTRPLEIPTSKAIVQPARFQEALADGHGFQRYFEHRRRRGDDSARIETAEKMLREGLWPALTDRLFTAFVEAPGKPLPWLPEDSSVTAEAVGKRGVYWREGDFSAPASSWMRDALFTVPGAAVELPNTIVP